MGGVFVYWGFHVRLAVGYYPLGICGSSIAGLSGTRILEGKDLMNEIIMNFGLVAYLWFFLSCSTPLITFHDHDTSYWRVRRKMKLQSGRLQRIPSHPGHLHRHPSSLLVNRHDDMSKILKITIENVSMEARTPILALVSSKKKKKKKKKTVANKPFEKSPCIPAIPGHGTPPQSHAKKTRKITHSRRPVS